MSKWNKNHSAIKRLMSELTELQSDTSDDFIVQPLEGNLFEWHFTMRGPADTEFDGGVYHGRIIFPVEYPNKPPDIVFLTPNGRFEVGQKICLNITSFHKETWNPLWGIRSVLVALISYFPQEAKGIGSIELPKPAREKLARESVNWTCPICEQCNSSALSSIRSRSTTSSNIDTPTIVDAHVQMNNTQNVESPKPETIQFDNIATPSPAVSNDAIMNEPSATLRHRNSHPLTEEPHAQQTMHVPERVTPLRVASEDSKEPENSILQNALNKMIGMVLFLIAMILFFKIMRV